MTIPGALKLMGGEMQDKKASGPLTPMEFAEMMQEFSEAGEWMSAQLRSKSGREAHTTDDEQDRLDPMDD